MKQEKAFDPHRLVIEAIDNALLEDDPNLTQQELDEERAVADVYEELRTQGYTDAEITAQWQGKTPKEILASHTESKRKAKPPRRRAVSADPLKSA